MANAAALRLTTINGAKPDSSNRRHNAVDVINTECLGGNRRQ